MVSKERAGCPEEKERGGVRSPGGDVTEAGEECDLQEQGGSEEGGKEKQEETQAKVEAGRRRWRWLSVSGSRDQPGVSEGKAETRMKTATMHTTDPPQG